MTRFIEVTSKDGAIASFPIGAFAFGIDANHETFIYYHGTKYCVTEAYDEIGRMIEDVEK